MVSVLFFFIFCKLKTNTLLVYVIQKGLNWKNFLVSLSFLKKLLVLN